MNIIVFYIISSITVLSSLSVVFSSNPVHSVLFLIFTFFNVAVLFLLSNAEFLAIALVLVYVGAVMVLFLFVIMMLDINVATLRQGFARYFPLGIIIAFFMVVAMGLIVSSDYFLSDIYSILESKYLSQIYLLLMF